MKKTFSTALAGRTITIETGHLAQQADAACTVQYGDTVVLATAVMSKEIREGIDFFPLVVDYEERLYAAGKIKGSRFIKREGRPSDEAILTARVVDRSIRPLFPEGVRNDVQVILTVLSVDQENDPDLVSLWAASCALTMSSIPWDGPVCGVRVGRINGEWVLNPTYEARAKSDFDLILVSAHGKTVMIEFVGKEVPEDVVADAITFGEKHVAAVTKLIEDVRAEVGKEKIVVKKPEETAEEAESHAYLKQIVAAFAHEHSKTYFAQTNKDGRLDAQAALAAQLEEQLKNDQKVSKENRQKGLALFEHFLEMASRKLVLEQKRRVDGRKLDEIRPLSAAVGLLPRTHGSGLFNRGETQVLSIITLGSPGDEQFLDTMEESGKKRYMHHYNFPGFSTGEVKPVRTPGRREIGHGALAEKALLPVLPQKDAFPYTIRVVSEVLSSNGSTSQASVCGSTLALMDAGVPVAAPVAGISIGLITDETSDAYELLTDIQGVEDHAGDMDFKVAGTKTGITAMQLDVKVVTLTLPMIQETLARAKEARLKILDVMAKAIAEPRKELSHYAPRILSVRIDPEKIRDVIGKGGETINKIIDECGGSDVTKIDIEQDGLVLITSTKAELGEKAKHWIEQMTHDVVPGETYEGVVTKIVTDMRGSEIGAIVEFLPGKDGMVHISELSYEHVEKVSDVVNVGDKTKVIVTNVDKERGRIGLSVKQLNPPPPGWTPPMREGFGGLPRRQAGRDRNGPPRRTGRFSRFRR